ncbi:MAG: SpoIIIAH-like family protein [Bacilli bacterium]
MNKQLVAFLSMLSLVLVLSVYYVMLPFENVPTTNSKNVSSIITTTDDAYFASLAAEQDNNYDLLFEENYKILCESTYTQEEKVEALETISQLETKRHKESEIRDLILGNGHPSCFIEIKDDSIYVFVKSTTKTKTEIVNIMGLVDTIIPSKYVYVKFV